MSARDSNIDIWLSKAANDLLNIENNLRSEQVPWDTICFHAQQVVEKTLKAFLIHHGEIAPRTHDLVALLTLSTQYAPSLARHEEDCRNLTYFAVSARYPDDVFEPDERDGNAMYDAASRVRRSLLDLLDRTDTT